MRLNQAEVDGIIQAIDIFRQNLPMELRLHGSRVDDSAKGGDIDLLLICEQTASATTLKDIKYKILAQMKENIGERKIDLLITSKVEADEEPFVQLVLPKSLLLKSWI